MARLHALGDAAALVALGDTIDPATNARVHALAARLHAQHFPWLHAIVPAYASLTLHYDPLHASWDREQPLWPQLEARLAPLWQDLPATFASGRRIEIPVWYGGAAGPDLERVAAQAGLAPDDVVARHAAPDYRVYFLGFMPGFPYLGGLDAALATPRLATPRAQVPAGSVAIGGAQTGIYPQVAPGGWNLIGRTPLRLFDPARATACLLAPGDTLVFRAIDAATFRALEATSC
jgi:KipI family sensor histidine kinase inhibitor